MPSILLSIWVINLCQAFVIGFKFQNIGFSLLKSNSYTGFSITERLVKSPLKVTNGKLAFLPSLLDKVKKPSIKAPFSKSLSFSRFSTGIFISLTTSWLAPIVNFSFSSVLVNNSVGFNKFFFPLCSSTVTIIDGVISFEWFE